MKKNKYPGRFGGPVVMTLVTLGPTSWFFIDWFSQNYDKLPVAFVAALLCTILSTVFWMNAIGCYWVPLGAIRYHWVPLDIIGCHWMSLGAIGCHWVSLGAIG